MCRWPLPDEAARCPRRLSLHSPALLSLRPQEVRSTTVAFLVLRIPTLRIKMVSRKDVFEANLKAECDLWHLMVKEMWAGKKLADDHKVWGTGRLCSNGRPGVSHTHPDGDARPPELRALRRLAAVHGPRHWAPWLV